ncbi:MAG: GNAT family N-acetyltransferase [Acidimicrobiales bacterium]
MEFSIREMTVDDAPAVAEVHVRSWLATYDGLLDADLLASLGVAERTTMWTSVLSSPNDGVRLLVERGGEAVGFLAGGSSSPSDPDAAEVFSIYLDPSVWRRGLGSTLLDAGVDGLRADGPKPVVLWVMDGNDAACRFYEARGWRFDGARKDEQVGAALVPHLRYRLAP